MNKEIKIAALRTGRERLVERGEGGRGGVGGKGDREDGKGGGRETHLNKALSSFSPSASASTAGAVPIFRSANMAR